MKLTLINTTKIILAILFFFCLIDLPYGFYQFVRFLALIGFSILAHQAFLQDTKFELFIYISLGLLFQPFFKIALGRGLWNLVDVFVGVGLIVSIFLKPSNTR